MVQETGIELIPWIHDSESQAHEDVVNYIKAIPKNSALCIEMSPGMRILYSKILVLS